MKPWQRVALAIIAGLAVVSTAGIVAVLAVLPNPEWIGERLKSFEQRPALANTASAKASPEANGQASASPPVAAAQTLGAPVAMASPAPSATPDPAARRQAVAERFINRYIREDRIQSDVCENLATTTAPFKTAEDFGRQIEASLLGEARPSAATEAVMLPVEYTLKNEAVRDLVDSARIAADRGNTGFIQKAQFYAQAARATASLLTSREELESISGHAYRLYAISRAAALKPELLQDPDTGDLCRGIERSAVDGVDRDVAFDRERLMRLLDRHGIDPASINYNPDMATGIRVVSDEQGLQIKMPWLDQIFKAQ